MRLKKPLSPSRTLTLSFLLLIVIGAALLLLPVSLAPGKDLTVTEAVFTATSAVCVTGLTVVDTGSHFSPFGQLVLLFLFQAGGLGVMVWSTGALYLMGTRLGLRGRVSLAGQVPGLTMSDVGSLAGRIAVFVLACEAVGALFLWCWSLRAPGRWSSRATS